MERNRLKKLIIDMAKLMSVTGYTEYDLNSLANRACDYFDECRMLPGGSVLFIRRCGRPDAKRIMIDTHYDEIGMMVSEILDGGFLRIEEVGGLDARVLQSSEICVWGTEPDLRNAAASSETGRRRPPEKGIGTACGHRIFERNA